MNMIVVIDIGTSSLRTLLMDNEGKILDVQKRGYSLSHPSSNAVEMDMALLDTALYEALKESFSVLKAWGKQATAFSVTAQRSSVIPVDEQGRALAPALMWQDTRSSGICEEVWASKKEIYAISGMKPSPVFSAPKMAYLKRTFPGVYASSYKLIGFCEYVLHTLTGLFVTDTSIASRTCLFDITKKEWSPFLLDLFSIDCNKLCTLVDVGTVIGKTTEHFGILMGIPYSIPVVSAGGDQQCAALGLGCIEKDSAMINLGTGAYVIALTDKPFLDTGMRVNCNVSAIPDKWIVEGAVLSAGKTLDWVNDNFFKHVQETRPYEVFTQKSRNVPIGSNGLRFSVQFAGKGTPIWNPNMKGSIGNLSFQNTKDDLARGVLEGIACAVDECVSCISELLGGVQEPVNVAGGLSKDGFFDQILSDMSRKELTKYATCEATAFGAWMSAAVALKKHNSYKEAFDTIIKGISKENYTPMENNSLLYEKIKEEIRNQENIKK
jgi:sugar (pentulose or hexulose) kinase